MENTIKETTRLLLQGTLTKDEADKILLDLHNVSNQRELLIAFSKYLKKELDKDFDEEFFIDEFESNL